MSEQIEGRNPVLEALRAGHEMIRIYIVKGETENGANARTKDILGLARKQGIPVITVDEPALRRMAQTRNHQGVIAIAAEWKYAAVADILRQSEIRKEDPFILVLDGVEDPQNFGAIIRTAEAAGVHGIIIGEHRAVGLNATVSRASAGAIEHMPVARVTNLTRAIEELKEKGLWFTGTDMEGPVGMEQANLTGPIGLVMGGEGKGISRLVGEHCDQLVRIPMWGKINSLNVSVATGIFLYEIRRQRVSQARSC